MARRACDLTSGVPTRLPGVSENRTGDERKQSTTMTAGGAAVVVPTVLETTPWELVAGVPYGETTTYSELARSLGPGRSRGTSAAAGRNPLCIIIPCHRVVGAAREALLWEQRRAGCRRKTSRRQLMERGSRPF
jgi:O-6-methylguanine DNA methyltransferase